MIINGTDLLLYYSTDEGATWTALGYATSHSLSYNLTTRDVSHKKSGTGKKIEPGKTSMTGSADGLVTYVADCDYHMLQGFIKARTPLKIAGAQDDSDDPDTDNIVTSDIYLTNVDITGAEEENTVYSIAFEANDDIAHTTGGASPTYGPELHTDANAASDPNSNEADATTGWTADNLDAFESQSSVVNTGAYAFHGHCNTTPASGARFRKTFTGLENGATYRFTFNWRHVGTGGGWRFYPNYTSKATIANTQTSFEAVDVTVVATSTTMIVTFDESNGTNDGGIYMDNFSMKKVL